MMCRGAFTGVSSETVLRKKGWHLSAEARRMISEARKGRRMSEDNRLKFLEGKRRYLEEYFRIHGHHPNKGQYPSTEFNKGNTLWVGRHHNDVTKKKLSDALRGKKLSPERRRAISRGHMGLKPWNKGLTRDQSPSVAAIGDKKKLWWTDERKRELAERNKTWLSTWWEQHPEAEEKLVRRQRPTRIGRLARASMERRKIPYVANKWIEDFCIPDLVLSELKIAIFCNGCFWHACPQHNPVVPMWLRNKIKDQEVIERLEKLGWRVLTVWEHDFKTNRDVVWDKLEPLLNHQGRGD
jgi:DNA mismatch endonuclease Vsr